MLNQQNGAISDVNWSKPWYGAESRLRAEKSTVKWWVAAVSGNQVEGVDADEGRAVKWATRDASGGAL